MRAARPALKIAAAAVTAAALLSAGACASGSTAAPDAGTSGSSSAAATSASGEPATLRVWLQGDTLKDIDITALNAEFEAAHPGVTVDLQEQTWGEYTTKVTTGLADTSDAAPDVLELGNTQVAQFAGAGALTELDKADFENSDTWLGGLEESSTYDGKLIAVPYYAGVRVGIYRTDLADAAGATPPFNSLDEMQAAGVKLLDAHGDDGSFSGLYFPSQYWYEGISFVWDAGGDIATQAADGTWTGPWIQPEAKAGLQRLKDLVDATSRGGDGLNEADDALVMAQDQAAMFIDASWKPAVVTDPETGNPDAQGQGQDLRGAGVEARHRAAAVPRRVGHRDQRQDPEHGAGHRLHRDADRPEVPAGAGRQGLHRELDQLHRRRPATRRRRSWSRPPPPAGSCRTRRTGPRSRTATCCRTCSTRSSPDRQSIDEATAEASAQITELLNS